MKCCCWQRMGAFGFTSGWHYSSCAKPWEAETQQHCLRTFHSNHYLFGTNWIYSNKMLPTAITERWQEMWLLSAPVSHSLEMSSESSSKTMRNSSMTSRQQQNLFLAWKKLLIKQVEEIEETIDRPGLSGASSGVWGVEGIIRSTVSASCRRRCELLEGHEPGIQ